MANFLKKVFMFIFMVILIVLMLVTSSGKANASEVNYLAMAIHHEARGESIQGKRAVANVIFNRVKHREFPNSIRAVVTQKGQFQWYRNHKLRSKKPISAETRALAAKLYNEFRTNKRVDNTRGSLFFVSNRVHPAPRAYFIKRIGGHKFFGIRKR